jgi:hypothetical protein
MSKAIQDQAVNIPTQSSWAPGIYFVRISAPGVKMCISVKCQYNNLFSNTGFSQDAMSSDYFLFHGSVPAARPVFLFHPLNAG